MDHAIIDPDQAYEEALRLTKYDDGNTKSNTLYWIATRGMSFSFVTSYGYECEIFHFCNIFIGQSLHDSKSSISKATENQEQQ